MQFENVYFSASSTPNLKKKKKTQSKTIYFLQFVLKSHFYLQNRNLKCILNEGVRTTFILKGGSTNPNGQKKKKKDGVAKPFSMAMW
jgi:hypothetical protein